MNNAFASFKFNVGDPVKHKGRTREAIGDVGIIIRRSLHEALDADGQPYYERGYFIVGYGIDTEAIEMEIERA